MIKLILSTENILLIGAMLLFISILAAKLSPKVGTPALLLFLFIGMLFGSDGLGIQFNNPEIAQFIGMLALSIILFSGGMETKYSEIKPVAAPGVVLATVGVLLTALLTGCFIYWICGIIGINIGFLECLLMASVMSSTDSASVFSILRAKKQGLKQNLRPLLELESGSNDPMAYILTILLITMITSGDMSIGGAVLMFFTQMIIGALAGFLLGQLAVKVINMINLENKSLYSVLLLAMVFFIFSFTDLIRGNGYLAVYIAGLVVGNHKIKFQKSLSTFFDGFTWLFQIVMFLMLGLLVNPSELLGVAILGLMVGVFMILISRPASVFLCMAPFRKFTLKAKMYVSWVGLRGAVPIIFATYPLVAGLEHANLIFNTVFFITIVSLLVQGTTVSPMAKLLKLSTDIEEAGFDIDIPEEMKAALTEMEVKADFLAGGNTLKDIKLKPNTLVMMIRRGDNYIVPKGDTEIEVGDKILFISTNAAELPEDYSVSKTSRREKAKAAISNVKAKGRQRHEKSKVEQEADIVASIEEAEIAAAEEDEEEDYYCLEGDIREIDPELAGEQDIMQLEEVE